ncbi:hypothetical protein BKA63DRAFT_489848 [Paraphoma chrysanthemicola]|nr:hypothetical protein BKA63DRAFT_489848 [Paraphoma chrysanthemicola]
MCGLTIRIGSYNVRKCDHRLHFAILGAAGGMTIAVKSCLSWHMSAEERCPLNPGDLCGAVLEPFYSNRSGTFQESSGKSFGSHCLIQGQSKCHIIVTQAPQSRRSAEKTFMHELLASIKLIRPNHFKLKLLIKQLGLSRCLKIARHARSPVSKTFQWCMLGLLKLMSSGRFLMLVVAWKGWEFAIDERAETGDAHLDAFRTVGMFNRMQSEKYG